MNTSARATMFTLLARYYESGLPLETAFAELIARNPSQRKQLAGIEALLRRGLSLDKAVAGTGLVSDWETRLLALGQQHGRLDSALSDIARHYENSHSWWRKLRSRLMLPAAVLLIAGLVLPLSGLVSGEVSVMIYLMKNVALALMLLWGWRWMSRADGYPELFDRVLTLGGANSMVVAYHRSRFLHAIARLIEAGLPAQEAVQGAVKSCRSAALRRSWQGVLAGLQSGQPLATALLDRGVLDKDGYALINSGEISGKLVEMLKHERDRLDAALKLKLDSLNEWLPRVFYLIVVALIAGQLF